MKLNRKGFTLVEMLIVIVIIGILAAAILPNLLGARDKANDTARISSVNNLNTAIVSYSHAAGEYPSYCGSAKGLLTDPTTKDTMNAQIEKIPTDPNGNNSFTFNGENTAIKGEYGYCGLKKGGNTNSAYVIVAKLSDPAKSNYIADSSDTDYISKAGLKDQDYEKVKKTICSSVKISSTTSKGTNTNGECTIKDDDFAKLRYVVIKS